MLAYKHKTESSLWCTLVLKKPQMHIKDYLGQIYVSSIQRTLNMSVTYFFCVIFPCNFGLQPSIFWTFFQCIILTISFSYVRKAWVIINPFLSSSPGVSRRFRINISLKAEVSDILSHIMGFFSVCQAFESSS